MKKLLNHIVTPVQIVAYLFVYLKLIDHVWLNFVIGYQILIFVIGIIALFGFGLIASQLKEDPEYQVSNDLKKSFADSTEFTRGYAWVMRIALFVVMCLNYPVWGTFYFALMSLVSLSFHSIRTNWLQKIEETKS